MANLNVQIITAAYDSGYRDWRMGRGPAHILEHGLRDVLAEHGYLVASTDVKVDFMTENAAAFGVCRALSERVKAAREAQAFPLLLTGNCGNALGTLAGLEIGKTGIVWFDAHGEFNTPDTTRSGFLDGMGLATITGRCWQVLASTVPGFSPMPENHIVLIGARELDPEERALLENSGVGTISAAQVRGSGIQNALAPHLERLRQEVEQVYVHLDLDVLDPTEAQANSFPAPEGLTVVEVKKAIEAVKAQFRIAAGGLASYDPSCDLDNRALNASLELLGALI
jgi:arginase